MFAKSLSVPLNLCFISARSIVRKNSKGIPVPVKALRVSDKHSRLVKQSKAYQDEMQAIQDKQHSLPIPPRERGKFKISTRQSQVVKDQHERQRNIGKLISFKYGEPLIKQQGGNHPQAQTTRLS